MYYSLGISLHYEPTISLQNSVTDCITTQKNKPATAHHERGTVMNKERKLTTQLIN